MFTAKESTGLEDPQDSSKEPPQKRPTAGQLCEYIAL